jgi:hypothetical protein
LLTFQLLPRKRVLTDIFKSTDSPKTQPHGSRFPKHQPTSTASSRHGQTSQSEAPIDSTHILCWRRPSGSCFRLFQFGAFNLALSIWRFRFGAFDLALSVWRFRSGAFASARRPRVSQRGIAVRSHALESEHTPAAQQCLVENLGGHSPIGGWETSLRGRQITVGSPEAT